MPYITKERREKIAPFVFQELDSNGNESYAVWIDPTQINTPGELNYAITELLLDWVENNPGYTGINAAVGALECAKLELYRRVAVPYEDEKIAENGDVY